MGESRVDTATVLFSDLVASTEHRTRLGEDGAEQQRAVHDGIVRGAITSNRGVVVKHLGDGAMATFTSAASAVAAAVELQQGIHAANRRGELDDVQVRIGISVGDVTFEDDDCFGLPVVEAQRLESSAEPGTIRCAELVMHLARGRGGHHFTDLGPLELKGLPDAVPACEIGWTPLQDSVPADEQPLPPVLARGGGLPFSGRVDALEALEGSWKQAITGGFELVLVAGEPGVGKTRLAAELARAAGDALVLAGRCDEDVQAPFQPFAAALDWYLDHRLASDAPLGGLGRHPGDLVRLLPDLATRVDGLPPALDGDPESERLRLFQAVTSWLQAGDDEPPVLLVLDDLHWADRPSLSLLRHLLGERPPHLMILCTYRDTDVDRVHPLSAVLADLRRDDAVTRLSLDGLDPDGVRELLVRTGGHELDEAGLAFAEVVHRETSGNPFFMGEVLRHLSETGALVERDGRWTSDLSPEDSVIPEGIREVVGRRLGRLGADAEPVLRAAAVVGHEFDVDVLIAVGAGTEDQVLDALDVATAANLLHELGVGRYRFAHALVRQTLHEELSSTRRARQHRKVAEALEARHRADLGPVLDQLATHWAEATAGGDQARAIELAIAVGDREVGQGAHEQAVLWFDRALDMIDDDPDRALQRRLVLVRLADAEVYTDDRNHRASMLAAAQEAIGAGDAATAHAALTVSARLSFDEDQPADPELVALLRLALDTLEDLTVAERAALLAHLAGELIYARDFAGRAALLDELFALLPEVELAERAPVLARAALSALALWTVERLEGWVATLRAAELDEADYVKRRTMLGVLSYFQMCLADRRGVEDARESMLAHNRSAGMTKDHNPKMLESMLGVLDGDLDVAASASAEMTALLEARGVPEATTFQATTSFGVARELEQTEPFIDLWLAATDDASALNGANAGAALMRLLNGRGDEAATWLDEVDLGAMPNDGSWPICMAAVAEITAQVGTSERAREVRALLAPKSGIFVATGGVSMGAADRLLALLDARLGDHLSADGHFERAIELHHRIESPTWIARTELDWAEALLERGEPATAAGHLDAAETAIGDLDLRESRRRLGELRARR